MAMMTDTSTDRKPRAFHCTFHGLSGIITKPADHVLFLEHAYGTRLESPYLNTCTLSRKLFPFHRKHSLEECCRRHRIPNEQKHRALSDARASAQRALAEKQPRVAITDATRALAYDPDSVAALNLRSAGFARSRRCGRRS